jgi:hypothetical protein
LGSATTFCVSVTTHSVATSTFAQSTITNAAISKVTHTSANPVTVQLDLHSLTVAAPPDASRLTTAITTTKPLRSQEATKDAESHLSPISARPSTPKDNREGTPTISRAPATTSLDSGLASRTSTPSGTANTPSSDRPWSHSSNEFERARPNLAHSALFWVFLVLAFLSLSVAVWYGRRLRWTRSRLNDVEANVYKNEPMSCRINLGLAQQSMDRDEKTELTGDEPKSLLPTLPSAAYTRSGTTSTISTIRSTTTINTLGSGESCLDSEILATSSSSVRKVRHTQAVAAFCKAMPSRIAWCGKSGETRDIQESCVPTVIRHEGSHR